MGDTDELFAGFRRTRIDVGSATINVARAGTGSPLLLLHGYPQTHAMWHKVAPVLAQDFTVVVADMRGYGDSSKPPAGEDHGDYSKRAMAADQVAVMRELGFERFGLVGHDRGARVAHRLALDHPEQVSHLALLDIIPTYTAFLHTNKDTARAQYHWFFLSQPHDLPERLIGSDPGFFLRWCLKSWGGGLDYFAPAALAEYERCFADPATIHATCEDYRAGVTIDLEHDEATLDQKISCPVRVLWGGRRARGRAFEMQHIWGERAREVSVSEVDCWHFLAEERPDEVVREILVFAAA